ncbi:MAG: hypothetical protein HY735_27390 [Verrucomicrobia bacterium]|nr:hypothetical protein [Verrucomicrobiota bacterium]
MTFDETERSILAGLADVLIPAGDGFPSASDGGVAGKGLDQILAVRPDLAAGLKSILQAAMGRKPAEVIAEMQSMDPESFGILAEIVPGAHFMNEQVRQQLGYTGQTPQPIDPRPDYLDEGLLQSVLDRGPIFRPTPMK